MVRGPCLSTTHKGVHGGFVLTVIVEAVGIELSVMQVMDSSSSILQAINKGDLLALGRLLGPGATLSDAHEVDPKIVKQGKAFLAKRQAESELVELLRSTTIAEVLKAKLDFARTVKGVDASLLEKSGACIRSVRVLFPHSCSMQLSPSRGVWRYRVEMRAPRSERSARACESATEDRQAGVGHRQRVESQAGRKGGGEISVVPRADGCAHQAQ
jgi:hypothetical protein